MTNTLFNVNLEGKVEAKLGSTEVRNNQTKYQAIAKDITTSVTQGWELTFLPQVSSNGTVEDFSKAVHNVKIPNYTQMKAIVLEAAGAFVSNPQNATTKKPVVFEGEGQPFRITVIKQKNSLSVTVRVKDVTSPFYMIAIEFIVTPDKTNPSVPYIVGEADNHNVATDEFFSYNAFFVGKKRMYAEIYANNNELTTSIAIKEHKGGKTYAIDRQNTLIQYIQKVDSIYKAEAYIIESSVSAFLVEKLSATILDIHHNRQATEAPQQQPQQAAPVSQGFAAFFGGQQQQQAAPMYTEQPASQGIQQSWSTNQYVTPDVSQNLTHQFDLGAPTKQ